MVPPLPKKRLPKESLPRKAGGQRIGWPVLAHPRLLAPKDDEPEMEPLPAPSCLLHLSATSPLFSFQGTRACFSRRPGWETSERQKHPRSSGDFAVPFEKSSTRFPWCAEAVSSRPYPVVKARAALRLPPNVALVYHRPARVSNLRDRRVFPVEGSSARPRPALPRPSFPAASLC